MRSLVEAEATVRAKLARTTRQHVVGLIAPDLSNCAADDFRERFMEWDVVFSDTRYNLVKSWVTL